MSNNTTSNSLESGDRAHFFHPSTHVGTHARGDTPNRMIEKGTGIYITDSNGRTSLDGFAGLYCVNIGYGRTEVADAISEQAHKLAYYHAYAGHTSEPSARLAQMIIERAPQNMSRVYFGLSGSDANETNIKLIWYYNNILGRPEKKKIISRWRGYHGSGIMTGSLTGLELFHNAFDLPKPPVLHTEAPYYFRRENRGQSEEEFSSHCADKLEQLILAEGADSIAAFIGEPVLGTGGIVPPPQGYWEKIQQVLNKYDILLIADEVVTAFGRLGSMFGSDHYHIDADLITIAKGLTSAYAPLSGVIVSDKIWKVLEQGADKMGAIGHGWTYSAHPLCTAAGVANLNVIDKEGLVENARDTGAYLQNSFKQAFADHPMVGEVRGEGLLAAIEFVKDKSDRVLFDPADQVGIKLSAAALENELITRAMPQGDILGFAPPLCINRQEVDLIVDKTQLAIEKVSKQIATTIS